MAREPKGRKPRGGTNPGGGRPPLQTHAEKAAADEFHRRGRLALPATMDELEAAMKATITVRGRNGHIMDTIPDWKTRLQAVAMITNKCGAPDQKEVKVEMTDGERADAWVAALEQD